MYLQTYGNIQLRFFPTKSPETLSPPAAMMRIIAALGVEGWESFHRGRVSDIARRTSSLTLRKFNGATEFLMEFTAIPSFAFEPIDLFMNLLEEAMTGGNMLDNVRLANLLQMAGRESDAALAIMSPFMDVWNRQYWPWIAMCIACGITNPGVIERALRMDRSDLLVILELMHEDDGKDTPTFVQYANELAI